MLHAGHVRLLATARAEGDAAANLALAGDRAEAVRNRIIREGISPNRVRAVTASASGTGGQYQSVVFLTSILVVLILASSLMALFYVWRIVETLYFKPVLQGDSSRREAPLQMLVMIWLAALANIFFGLFPQAPLALAKLSAAALLGGGA